MMFLQSEEVEPLFVIGKDADPIAWFMLLVVGGIAAVVVLLLVIAMKAGKGRAR